MYDIRDEIKDITDEIKDIFKTYIKPIPNPNALSIAMVGLSSLVLVYFVAYKEDPPGEGESPSQESPPSVNQESHPQGYEEQTTRGGANRHNKKTRRRKL
jgi:hypothetical protein